MIRAVLADTGPLYAAVDPDDEHHARALLELQKLNRDRQEIVILYPTLLEAYSLDYVSFGQVCCVEPAAGHSPNGYAQSDVRGLLASRG